MGEGEGRRVLGVILCLASLNLALRGHDEKIGKGIAQGGNFLVVVSMLNEFDSIIGLHVFT